MGHSIQFRPFSLKLLKIPIKVVASSARNLYIYIEREHLEERRPSSEKMVYLSTVCLAPKGMQDQKKREKPLWRSLLRTTIWQQPINPHIPFFHKTSLQKKKEKKRTSERSNQGNSSLKLEKKELFTMYNLV